MLVLRNDVWHGGIVGGKGNIRFHAAILVSDDIPDHTMLHYDTRNNNHAKEAFNSLVVDYNEGKSLLPPNEANLIPELPKYLEKICIFLLFITKT